MAKAGTLSHPKTLHLADLLGVEPWAALGLLEALWSWAAEYACDGAIGRHIDAVIADGVKWRGTASKLVYFLVESKWLDPVRDDEVRFVIHDWDEHKQERVKKKLERAHKSVYAGDPIERNKWLREHASVQTPSRRRPDTTPPPTRTASRQHLDDVPSRTRVCPALPNQANTQASNSEMADTVETAEEPVVGSKTEVAPTIPESLTSSPPGANAEGALEPKAKGKRGESKGNDSTSSDGRGDGLSGDERLLAVHERLNYERVASA